MEVGGIILAVVCCVCQRCSVPVDRKLCSRPAPTAWHDGHTRLPMQRASTGLRSAQHSQLRKVARDLATAWLLCDVASSIHQRYIRRGRKPEVAQMNFMGRYSFKFQLDLGRVSSRVRLLALQNKLLRHSPCQSEAVLMAPLLSRRVRQRMMRGNWQAATRLQQGLRVRSGYCTTACVRHAQTWQPAYMQPG